MNGSFLKPLLDAFRGDQLKPTVILLLSPTLLVTWHFFGSIELYLRSFGPAPLPFDETAALATYTIAMTLGLFVLVPALVVKVVFRERLADYGIQLGLRKRTFRSYLMIAPLMLLAAYLGSSDPGMIGFFGIKFRPSPSIFALHVCTFAAFYVGWEFIFRGFIQFGLRPSVGAANAILIGTLASVLFHINTPMLETYAAIIAGIGWGILAFRTESILSGLLQHMTLGIAMQAFMCYGQA